MINFLFNHGIPIVVDVFLIFLLSFIFLFLILHIVISTTGISGQGGARVNCLGQSVLRAPWWWGGGGGSGGNGPRS